MTLVGNSEGKLRVQRQVEDYALRGVEFEAMGYLTFMVETYERSKKSGDTSHEKKDEEDDYSSTSENARYLNDHPKAKTHYRVCRLKNHNWLPNIVGPWPPRRDSDESTNSYYFASMLALLKPWRDLRELIGSHETWEKAFIHFMDNATQRDHDVVAGCQYYYESRNVVVNHEEDEEAVEDDNERRPNDVDGEIDDQSEEVSSTMVSVNISFFL